MPVVSANGIQQYYEVTGDGPPLLLVAGMGGTANYWGDQVDFFAAHYTVITYDQRGTGRSDHSPVSSMDAQSPRRHSRRSLVVMVLPRVSMSAF